MKETYMYMYNCYCVGFFRAYKTLRASIKNISHSTIHFVKNF